MARHAKLTRYHKLLRVESKERGNLTMNPTPDHPAPSPNCFQNSPLLLFALFPTPHLSSGWLHHVFGRGLCRVQYLATAPFSQSASPWWAPSRPHGNRRPSLINLSHCHSVTRSVSVTQLNARPLAYYPASSETLLSS